MSSFNIRVLCSASVMSSFNISVLCSASVMSSFSNTTAKVRKFIQICKYLAQKCLHRSQNPVLAKQSGAFCAPDCMRLGLFYFLPLEGIGLVATEDEELAINQFLAERDLIGADVSEGI